MLSIFASHLQNRFYIFQIFHHTKGSWPLLKKVGWMCCGVQETCILFFKFTKLLKETGMFWYFWFIKNRAFNIPDRFLPLNTELNTRELYVPGVSWSPAVTFEKWYSNLTTIECHQWNCDFAKHFLMFMGFFCDSQKHVTGRWYRVYHRRHSEAPRSCPAVMGRVLLN